MNNCNVCIHTNDKHYTETPEIAASEFSALNIGTHKLISNVLALNNKVWDENEVVYWQLDSEYEWLSKKVQIDIMKDALLETSLTTKLRIRQRRRQTGDAHLKINWLGAKDEKYLANRPGVLAFAYGPQIGIGGDCTFNSDQIWRLPSQGKITVKEAFDLGMIDDYDRSRPNNTLRTYDPYHTAKHELGGHSCGMHHITDINQRFTAIMYPYYNGVRMFSEGDLDYLFQLYTKMGYWQRAIAIAKHKMGFN